MNPEVPIIPVYINGPDKILPKIDVILVPFISDIYIGNAIYYDGTPTKKFRDRIKEEVEKLYLAHKRKETL